MPCCQSMKARLGSQCCFLVSLEVCWTKDCCKEGPEVSLVDTKLKTGASISYAAELEEILCSHRPHCNHPGIVIINKHIHLPSLLRLLTPAHSYRLDFSKAKSWNKADSKKLGQQLKWLPKRNLFAQAKAVLSPNMGVIILQPFAWKTMKGRQNRLGNYSLLQ